MSAQGHLGQDSDARVAAWLSAVARVPPDGFTPVERFDDVPAQARADSFYWCDSIFRSELNPHNEALGARHAFHAATDDTPDLLRHELAAGGLELTVTEGRNFILVQVERSSLDILSLRSESVAWPSTTWSGSGRRTATRRRASPASGGWATT